MDASMPTLDGDRPIVTIYGYCGACSTAIHERTERTSTGKLLCPTCWSVRLAHPDPMPARAYGPPAPTARAPRKRWAVDRATGEAFDYVVPDMDTVEPWVRGGIRVKRPGSRGAFYALPAQRKNPTIQPKGASASSRRRGKQSRAVRAGSDPVAAEALASVQPARVRRTSKPRKPRARTMSPTLIARVVEQARK